MPFTVETLQKLRLRLNGDIGLFELL